MKQPAKHCSFCGKLSDLVALLISGPGGVMICNECVSVCNDIIAQHTVVRERPAEDPHIDAPTLPVRKKRIVQRQGARKAKRTR